ncbi:MAG: NAD-dependent epimerase/dehydratase family protein [Thiogranum sp.]|nr:NAD-dependent epimerase/dehydratase family protein [Thiogranum sp.]
MRRPAGLSFRKSGVASFNAGREPMSSDKILVTGANGFIGRMLVRELQRRGYNTCCAVRSHSEPDVVDTDLIEVGEVDASTDWSRALVGVDIVIHLVGRAHILDDTAVDPRAAFNAVNRDGTRRLAESAATAGVRRIVYVSSIGVNGDHTDTQQAFTEEMAAVPHNDYAASKYAAEQALAEIANRTGLETVILRPPLVYGPGNPGNFLRLLQLVDKGVPLPLGSVRNQRSMIYVANLVDALIAAAFRTEAAGRLYLVSDDELVATPQLISDLAGLMGKPTRIWPLRVGALRLAAKCTGKSDELEKLIGSLVIDSRKIRRELEWAPPFTQHAGLAETVHWFREKGNS